MDSLSTFTIPGSNYGYSGVEVETLQSPSNTIVTGLYDESGSTAPFKMEIEACAKEIVKSLRYSPRKDFLIYRHCHFGTSFREHHGYKPLSQCNEVDYDGCYKSGGRTTLYDSTVKVLDAKVDYAKQMVQKKYFCNGFLYVVSDGQDWGSTLKMADAKASMARALTCESLESLFSLLIGVNIHDAGVKKELEEFHREVGFTQFESVENASADNLAKIAGFISASIISQSQQLGSGGPSASLTF